MILWQRKALYACYIIVVLAVTGLVWALSPTTYEVGAIISVKPGLYGDNGRTSQRAEQTARSQVALLESENVIRRAIAKVGAGALYPNHFSDSGRPEDHAFAAARVALSVRFEPLTDLIRISFRHDDPYLAVRFTEALVQSFTERYFELYSNVSAVDFFWEQQKRSSEAFARASAQLAKFAADNQIYRADEQQRLLLDQRSRVASLLLATEGAIEEKKAQASTIPHQLAQMQPVGRLPQVTGLTQHKGAPPQANEKQSQIERLAADPPLLLVRVYQETIATLVKLNTDLAGLKALEASQAQALRKIDAELSSLATGEAEFERLRLEVKQAKENAELFTRKALEEQLSQDLNARKLSSVQVVQQATMPLAPISPRPLLLLAVAITLCLAPLAAAIAYEIAAYTSNAANVPAVDSVRLSASENARLGNGRAHNAPGNGQAHEQAA